MEGTGRITLRRATGHITGTALPGQPGNVAISGRRDMFFQPLRNIRQNHSITLVTSAREYRYGGVLASNPNEVLTFAPGGPEKFHERVF
ncbi:MAG: sortase domain-bontaining protein [Bryobacteraceae bacterium]